MKEKIFSLEGYDLDNFYRRSHQYLRETIDWDAISKNVGENGIEAFPVAGSLELFSHLTLDERYELYCYVAREYHGLWGRVAAVPKGDQQDLVVKPGIFGYTELTLPDSAVPPMEALYHDGTPEVYFESVLCTQLFRAVPYVGFERQNHDNIWTAPPGDLSEQWNVHIHLPDWTPKVFWEDGHCTMIACKFEYENGIGSSNGRSRIKLSEYSFWSKLSFLHGIEPMKRVGKDIYPSRIEDDGRYGEGRCCCVAKEVSILVAEEI